MQQIKNGNLIAINENGKFFYFLVLSGTEFFGAQWTYAFHITSEKQLNENDILKTYGNGFHALIDFIEERRKNSIIKICSKIETTPYINTSNLKARIDQHGGGHLWFIYSPKFDILSKQEKLDDSQYNFPIASNISAEKSIKLIEKKWFIHNVVMEENHGQFPI